MGKPTREEIKMDPETVAKVEAYVRANYKRTYPDSKSMIIKEYDNLFTVQAHKDGSPMFLGKGILNK